MKTFIHLIFTFFISTVALWGSLAGKGYSWPCYGVALGIWAFFCWRLKARSRRAEMKRQLVEYRFREYMRSRHER